MDDRPAGYGWFVVAGVAGIVATTVVSAMRDPTGESTLVASLYALTAFFAIFFAFWWYRLVLRRPRAEASPASSAALPDASALRSWSSLASAMMLRPEDSEVAARAERRGRGGIAWFLAFGTALVAVVLTGAWMLALGVDRVGGLPVMGVWPIVVLAFPVGYVLFMLLGGGFGKAVEAGQDMLEPLGLQLIDRPSAALIPTSGGGARGVVVGATVMGGARRGRPVQIHLDAAESRTMLGAPGPAFSITSDRGRLRADPAAPAGVQEALGSLRRAKRWEGVEVEGGPEGILVRRARRPAEGWLYDLWLAERIADRLAFRA